MEFTIDNEYKNNKVAKVECPEGKLFLSIK